MNIDNQKKGIIVTVFSTASAVGKTLLSINMAAQLAYMGYKTCLVDMDLQFGDVGNYLNIESPVTIFDATDKLSKQGYVEIEEYLHNYSYKNVNFSVLLAPNKLEEAYNISTEHIKKCIENLQKKFEYVVVDTTSAFSEANLAVMDISTLVTFVGIVDFIPTIKNMKIGYDTMRNIGYDKHKIRLILNRSDSKTDISLDDVEKLLQEKFYHIIPNDFMQAQKSIADGIPLVAEDKESLIRNSIRQLVTKYMSKGNEPRQRDKTITSFVKNIFK